jgi:uncharacterized protein
MVATRFFGRNPGFLTLFTEAAAGAAEAATLVERLLGDPTDPAARIARLRELEHHGDALTHGVHDALAHHFLLPLVHADARHLAGALDDLTDAIEEAGRRWWLYQLGPGPAPARLLARVLAEQTDALGRAVRLVAPGTERADLSRHLREVDRLESEADDAFATSLAGLYVGVGDVPGVIRAMRWGELYALLEEATDRAKDVALVLTTIALTG